MLLPKKVLISISHFVQKVKDYILLFFSVRTSELLQFTYLPGLPSRMVYLSHFCMYFLPTAGESTKEAPPEAEVPLDSPPVQRDGTAVIV